MNILVQFNPIHSVNLDPYQFHSVLKGIMDKFEYVVVVFVETQTPI